MSTTHNADRNSGSNLADLKELALKHTALTAGDEHLYQYRVRVEKACCKDVIWFIGTREQAIDFWVEQVIKFDMRIVPGYPGMAFMYQIPHGDTKCLNLEIVV